MSPGPKRIGAPFIKLPQVDSTNNYATALAHAGMAEHGTAVLAEHQVAGKGQRHKAWTATPGANITMSLLLAPAELAAAPGPVRLTADGAFRFSMAVALGTQRFFSRYAGEETFVKWPNDLYWRDRKAGGILIENILAGDQWKWAVVGLGVNINEEAFGPAAPRAVSLRQVTGRAWDVRALALELCASLEEAFAQLAADPASIVADYHSVLFGRGQTVRLRKDNRVFAAQVLGVTETGCLRVRHGVEEEFAVGEVEWVF